MSLVEVPPLPPELTQEQITAALLREADIVATPFYIKHICGDQWYKLHLLTPKGKEIIDKINLSVSKHNYCCTSRDNISLVTALAQYNTKLIIQDWRQ